MPTHSGKREDMQEGDRYIFLSTVNPAETNIVNIFILQITLA